MQTKNRPWAVFGFELFRVGNHVDYFCVAAGAVKVRLLRLLKLDSASLSGVEGVVTSSGNVLAAQYVVAALTDDDFASLRDLTVVNLYTKSFTL
jgi:hypothetical protein